MIDLLTCWNLWFSVSRYVTNYQKGNQQEWLHNGDIVGGLEHVFPNIGNFIIPTDELIFFRGVGLNHQPGIVLVILIVPKIWMNGYQPTNGEYYYMG